MSSGNIVQRQRRKSSESKWIHTEQESGSMKQKVCKFEASGDFTTKPATDLESFVPALQKVIEVKRVWRNAFIHWYLALPLASYLYFYCCCFCFRHRQSSCQDLHIKTVGKNLCPRRNEDILKWPLLYSLWVSNSWNNRPQDIRTSSGVSWW